MTKIFHPLLALIASAISRQTVRNILKEEGISPGKELILSNSQRTGVEITMESDYRFVLRAGELGLSRIELSNRDSPFLARDERKTYRLDGVPGRTESASR